MTEPTETTKAAAEPHLHSDAQAPQASLARLMSDAAKSAPPPDLEREAIAAAEQALAESRRAVPAAKRAPTAAAPKAAPSAGASRRERILRTLLAVNLLAMIGVVFLPSPKATTTPAPAPAAPPDLARPTATEPLPPVRTPSLDDPVIRAFAAADAHDYRTAIQLLEQHLAETPRMDPARKANLLLALQHYTAQISDFAKSQEYQRKVEALRSSHSLPEDLLAMASEAEQAGDIESMRRAYARLLLQQRQIPSALFRHVAEAYLKMGDSYRSEAEAAARASREQELEQARAKLRQQAAQGEAGRSPEARK